MLAASPAWPSHPERPPPSGTPQPHPLYPEPDRGEQTTRLRFDLDLYLLIAALLALGTWFFAAAQQPRSERARAVPARFLAQPADPAPFRFAAPASARHMRIPAGHPPAAAAAIDPAPPDVETSSLQTHALMAGPGFDPLGVVLIDGLPREVTLSAGSQLSETQWGMALGDLDHLVIQIPNGQDRVRAALEIRNRAGGLVHAFTVDVRHEPQAIPLARDPDFTPPSVKTKSRAKPVRQKKKAAGAGTGKAQGPSTPKPPPSATLAAASGAPLPVKSPAPPSAAAPSSAPYALPPAGLGGLTLNPDPKDSAGSGLLPEERDDPRFMTLRGLGGG